jgi:Domain of unknown function (DUF4157)
MRFKSKKISASPEFDHFKTQPRVTHVIRSRLVNSPHSDSLNTGRLEFFLEVRVERLKLQRKTNSDHEQQNTFKSSLIEQAANNGSGQTLDPALRATLEPQFGHSFADVRVFSDAQADRMARNVNARAFTVGQDVFFRAGEYNPNSSQGQHLLAHELTHTIQQRGASLGGNLEISQPSDVGEREADTAAHDVLAGRSVQVEGSSDASIQREEGTVTMPEVTVEGDGIRSQAYDLGLEDGRGRVSANRYIFLGNPEYLVEYDRGYKEGLSAPYELPSALGDGKPSTIEALSPEKAESDKKDTEEREREQKAEEQRWEFMKEMSQELEHL